MDAWFLLSIHFMANTMSDYSHISSLEVPGIIIGEAFLILYKQKEVLLDNWFKHRQETHTFFLRSQICVFILNKHILLPISLVERANSCSGTK